MMTSKLSFCAPFEPFQIETQISSPTSPLSPQQLTPPQQLLHVALEDNSNCKSNNPLKRKSSDQSGDESSNKKQNVMSIANLLC